MDNATGVTTSGVWNSGGTYCQVPNFATLSNNSTINLTISNK
jgi:hypothetical protein